MLIGSVEGKVTMTQFTTSKPGIEPGQFSLGRRRNNFLTIIVMDLVSATAISQADVPAFGTRTGVAA